MKYTILLLSLILSACASMNLTFDQYGKKFQDNKKEFTVNKNYQALFAEMSQALEKCEQKSVMLVDWKVLSEVHADKGYADISLYTDSWMKTDRGAWGRLYKTQDNKTKVLIYYMGMNGGTLEKYAKGNYDKKCLE